MSVRRIRVRALVAAGALAAALAQVEARADGPCDAWVVEYALNANVKITDTTMGAGNGVFAIGPGVVVVRYDAVGGEPGGRAEMLEYRMRDHFTVHASFVVGKTDVEANTVTCATPNACGVAAEGTLVDRRLTWKTNVAGMRSDGTVTCTGAFCGKFGAPPKGTSPMHVPPHSVTFKPFVFSEDKKTFTMDYSVVSKHETPSQTSLVALAGREVKRSCAVRKPCP
jgi:hypothetical protein